MRTTDFPVFADKERVPLQAQPVNVLRPDLRKAVASPQKSEIKALSSPKKCDSENLDNFKVKAASDSRPFRKYKFVPELKICKESSTQTIEVFEANGTITAEDLTGDNPSEHYWERLAKNKAAALEKVEEENLQLKKKIEALESELKVKDEMLEEAKAMAEVIKELVAEDQH